MSTREQDLQSVILAYLKAREGVWSFKTIVSNRAGIPDIIAVVDGQVLAIECKVNHNKLSDKQKLERDKILNAGGRFVEARQLTDVTSIVADIKRIKK